MIATLITRIFQMIFAIIVLALSVRAANWQEIGSVPTTTAYCAFAGAFALLVTIVGFASIWLTAIPKIIMSGLDGLAALLLLAGGIVSLLPSDRIRIQLIQFPGIRIENCGRRLRHHSIRPAQHDLERAVEWRLREHQIWTALLMEQSRGDCWALQGSGGRCCFPLLWICCLCRRCCVVLFGSEARQDSLGC